MKCTESRLQNVSLYTHKNHFDRRVFHFSHSHRRIAVCEWEMPMHFESITVLFFAFKESHTGYLTLIWHDGGNPLKMRFEWWETKCLLLKLYVDYGDTLWLNVNHLLLLQINQRWTSVRQLARVSEMTY